MRNMSSIISSHNKNVLKSEQKEFGCNWRCKNNCPLGNKCLTLKVIYKAEVRNDENEDIKIYIGQSETPFKERYRNHTKSFNNKRYVNETVLSKYVWDLKDRNVTPTINWSILKSIKGNPNSNGCSLCSIEKLFIISNLDNKTLLNKRNEFVSKCRHINKNMINSVKSDSMD